jgi:signal peptidase I
MVVDGKRIFREILEVVIPAIILFLVIRAFLFEARYVPSPSMHPTIMVWDRFLVEKVTYRFRQPERGEIVVFRPPAHVLEMIKEMSVPNTPLKTQDFIKRIIGLPGETVRIREGTVYIDGRPLVEDYISPDRQPLYEYGPVQIPEGHYLMLGDNRNHSWDGHNWGFVPRKNIIGRAIWRFWPLNRIGTIR